MSESNERIIYRLHKKGSENYTDFDRLLLESNPIIKDGVRRLSEIDRESYMETRRLVREKADLARAEADKKKRWSLLCLPTSAVACFLVLFSSLIIRFNTMPAALGGDVNLYLSSEAEPDRFYSSGSSFRGGEELKLAFQPGSELREIGEGVLFSVNSRLESTVYYHHEDSLDRLDRRRATQIDETILLDSDLEYIYFFVILSETPFDEVEQIAKVRESLTGGEARAGRIFTKLFKDRAFSYLYLKREILVE